MKKIILIFMCLSMFVTFGCQSFAEEANLFVDDIKLIQLKQELKYCNEQKDKAAQMATLARELGLPEDSETIITAKKVWDEENTKAIELTTQISAYDTNHYFSYNIFQKTNLSSNGFDKLLKETSLNGLGQAFYDMEQKYDINGLFALAVAKTESNLGDSKLAKTKNNFFGMIGCKYDTQYNGIMAFGKLMRNSIYENKSIEKIAKIYCPSTNSDWASQNRTFMKNFWNDIFK